MRNHKPRKRNRFPYNKHNPILTVNGKGYNGVGAWILAAVMLTFLALFIAILLGIIGFILASPAIALFLLINLIV